jgi:phage-related protein
MQKYTPKSYTREEYDAKLAFYRERSGLAEVLWLGDSRDVLRSFPGRVQGDLGYALYQVQLGQMPPDSKPMKTVGPGVYELREQDERGWYRLFYLKKIAGAIYVLHCFEKRTAKTEKKDIEVAKERLKRLHEQQGKKPKQADRPPDKGKRP